jgi:hypothetical protein
MKKKFNKGKVCIYLGLLCIVLFMLPLYMSLFFNVNIDKELFALSIAPGFTGIALFICGNYIELIEEELNSINQKS